MKTIHCAIHGTISVGSWAWTIICSPHFQKLAKISQLGLCSKVFPTANHNRYSHSIGTYYLSKKIIQLVCEKTRFRKFWIPCYDKWVTIDPHICELVAIGGLCHDLGHGPFSHLYDHVASDTHEERSCNIFRRIIQETKIPINEKDIQFVQSLIRPTEDCRGAIYQIVCNNRTGIDADKFDYLVRDSRATGIPISFNPERLIEEFIVDSEGDIAYPSQSIDDVYQLFYSRYRMHRLVYQHHRVKCIELMVLDIFQNLKEENCEINFDILDDGWLEGVLYFGDQTRYHKAREIYERIKRRDFYSEVPAFTPDSRMIKIRAGYHQTNTDPFPQIKFYDRANPAETYSIDIKKAEPLSDNVFEWKTKIWVK